MSAFVVGKAHINAMVRAGIGGRYGPLHWYPEGCDFEKSPTLTVETADRVGQMLLDENVKSVMARYDDCEVTNLPGRTNAEWLIPFEFVYTLERITAIETLSILACYEYQSCEHDGWKDSEAKCFCDALRKNAINRLPGYDEAPWEWTEWPQETLRRII